MLRTLCEIANKLDKLGYYDAANEIDAIIKHCAFNIHAGPEWNVRLSNKAEKARHELPNRIQHIIDELKADLRVYGPRAGPKWRQQRLENGDFHCHLTYRYVATWRVVGERDIEIRYVGSREGAPY